VNPSVDAGAWLTLRRTLPEDMQQRELYASIDGKRIAVLLYGDEATFDVAPGRHELVVHNTLSRKKFVFDAVSGQHVRFKTAIVPGKGFAYFAFFVGAALMYTLLEREDDGPGPSGPVLTSLRVGTR
jgi:hypothetical protein